MGTDSEKRTALNTDMDRLEDIKRQFEAIFANVPIGITYLTPDMRFIRINKFLEDKLKLTSEDIAGKHCYETVGMYKDDPSRKGEAKICDVCGVKKALETGTSYKFTRRVSNNFTVENMGVPIKDDSGNIIGVVEIIVDITDRVQLEEQLERHASELEEAVRQKTRELVQGREDVITMLTHDLKTPLTSVIGYCSLLLDSELGSLQDDARAAVEGINANSQRMLGLVRNFLSAGRIDEDKFRIAPSPVKLDSLVRESIKNMEPQLKEKGLTVDVELKTSAPHVSVDREHMERVFYNLISNAIKFTPHGGSISISAYDASDGYINLEVSDTGEGIPQEELPLLFDKYYQGSNRSLGTGLGLFIAKNIVEAHQGDISVTSMSGRGTTFTIRLPHERS